MFDGFTVTKPEPVNTNCLPPTNDVVIGVAAIVGSAGNDTVTVAGVIEAKPYESLWTKILNVPAGKYAAVKLFPEIVRGYLVDVGLPAESSHKNYTFVGL